MYLCARCRGRRESPTTLLCRKCYQAECDAIEQASSYAVESGLAHMLAAMEHDALVSLPPLPPWPDDAPTLPMPAFQVRDWCYACACIAGEDDAWLYGTPERLAMMGGGFTANLCAHHQRAWRLMQGEVQS